MHKASTRRHQRSPLPQHSSLPTPTSPGVSSQTPWTVHSTSASSPIITRDGKRSNSFDRRIRRLTPSRTSFKTTSYLLHENTTVRCDKGGEYTAGYFREFCKQTGIEQEFAATNTPQKNRMSERDGRAIMSMVRCNIIDTSMPNSCEEKSAKQRPTSSIVLRIGRLEENLLTLSCTVGIQTCHHWV